MIWQAPGHRRGSRRKKRWEPSRCQIWKVLLSLKLIHDGFAPSISSYQHCHWTNIGRLEKHCKIYFVKSGNMYFGKPYKSYDLWNLSASLMKPFLQLRTSLILAWRSHLETNQIWSWVLYIVIFLSALLVRCHNCYALSRLASKMVFSSSNWSTFIIYNNHI